MSRTCKLTAVAGAVALAAFAREFAYSNGRSDQAREDESKVPFSDDDPSPLQQAVSDHLASAGSGDQVARDAIVSAYVDAIAGHRGSRKAEPDDEDGYFLTPAEGENPSRVVVRRCWVGGEWIEDYDSGRDGTIAEYVRRRAAEQPTVEFAPFTVTPPNPECKGEHGTVDNAGRAEPVACHDCYPCEDCGTSGTAADMHGPPPAMPADPFPRPKGLTNVDYWGGHRVVFKGTEDVPLVDEPKRDGGERS